MKQLSKITRPKFNLFFLSLITVFVGACSIVINSHLIEFRSVKAQKDTAPLCENCNVIIVSLDTLSANHLPCYGYERNTSPNLCGFAKNNLLFKNAYANSFWTLPSHVSMFTGLYPITHKVVAYRDKLDKNIPFLPEILHNNGYATIFSMPRGDPTLPIKDVYNRGIDYIYNEDDNNWATVLNDFEKKTENGQKVFLFLHTYHVHDPYLIENNPKIYTNDNIKNIPLTDDGVFGNPITTDFVEYLIKQIQFDLSAKVINPEYNEELINCVIPNKKNIDKIKTCLNIYRPGLNLYRYNYYYRQNIDINDPRQIDYLRALYDQKINEMDENMLPLIFSLFENEKISNNTILIITADHGEEFMEHGHIRHETLYDSNIRVPFIMHIPGLGPRSFDYYTESVNIMPTVMDLLGLEKSKILKLQGTSLVSLLAGNRLKKTLLVAGDDTTVLRENGWKLFLDTQNETLTPQELYNTNIDPAEQNNILFSNFDIAKQLTKEYLSEIKRE